MRIQKQGDGDHMGMFPQLVRGLSQKGDTRAKAVSNRTVWTGESLSSLMGILLVSQYLLVCLDMLQPLYIDFPVEYTSKEVRGHRPLVLLPLLSLCSPGAHNLAEALFQISVF